MTRRGAVLSLLLAPFGQQTTGKLSLTEPASRTFLKLWFPKKATDNLIEVRWSDGTTLTLTEADVRKALEGQR